jgi:S-formylglutathione hydrolase
MWNDHTSWTVERYGNLPEKLERLILQKKIPEIILISPNGENSFYTDFLDGSQNFEKFAWRDLIELVEPQHPVRGTARNRAIAGVSMGGYGSLKIAMKHPELYAVTAGVSPIVFVGEDPSGPILSSDSRAARYFSAALKPVFGMPFNQEHWHDNSLEVLAREAELGNLRIYFSYGTADRYNDAFPMELGVRSLDRILTDRGIPHEFEIYDSAPHGWSLVSEYLEETFAFLTQTF